MPKIPLSRKAGMIDHVRSESPVSGAGQSLKYYGGGGTAEAFARAGERISRSTAQLGSAMMEYAREMQNTEDHLAAVEAKNLFRNIQGELITRMTENPASYNEFKSWAVDANKRYNDESEEIRAKMSVRFRKQFEAEMENLQIQAVHERTRTGTQAHVTAEYNRFQNLFKSAALAGDRQTALDLLNNERGTLINDAEYEIRMNDLEILGQSGEVKRLAQTDPAGILSALEARTKSGSYEKYTKIPESFREGMIRYARSRDSQIRADENAQLLDQLNSGMIVSREEIEEKFSLRTSPEDLRQKMEQIQIVDRFNSARKRASSAAQKEQYDRKFNTDEYKIITAEFSSNPSEAATQYNTMKRKIMAEYANDPGYGRLLSQLDKTYNAQKASPGKKISHKENPLYRAGSAILRQYKKEGRLAAYNEDNWFLKTGGDKSPGTVGYVEQMMTLDLDHYLEENPDAKLPDLQKFLEDRITFYNKNTVAEIGKMAMARKGKQQVEQKAQKFGTFNGKKVVFKDGKWEYVR